MTQTDDVNALLDEARVPFIVKAAAVSVAAAGLVVLLVGVQNLTLVTWRGGFAIVPWTLVLLGAAGIGVGAKLVRARGWSLAAALACSGLLTAAAAGFVILAGLSGLFSALSMLALGAAIAALVFTVLAVGPFRQLAEVRRRLRGVGYDLDL